MERKLGVLQLKTTFPRPIGDVGHPCTWGKTPTVIRVVEEAEMTKVVDGLWGEDLVDAFVREGQRLIREENCVAFVTSCGFLATMHPLLASRLPFMGTSSLIQVGWLQQSFLPILPDGRHQVGVITFKKSALAPKHFQAVAAHPETPFVGLPQPGFFSGALAETLPYNFDGMAAEMVDAARQLLNANDGIKAIVLECTNMPPYSRVVSDAVGLPVYDIITLGKYVYNAACPVGYTES